MSVDVINSPVEEMWQNRSATLQQFGKDHTGEISYCFNSQGFRSDVDYNFVPQYAFFGCSIVFGIGVPQKNTFAGQFESVHNYGLATNYSNTDCFDTIHQFIKSKWYTQHTKLAVIWKPGDQDLLLSHLDQLQQYPIIHFFCGNSPGLLNCYNLKSDFDHDVSNSHPGPKTHKFIHQLLCQLFDQL